MDIMSTSSDRKLRVRGLSRGMAAIFFALILMCNARAQDEGEEQRDPGGRDFSATKGAPVPDAPDAVPGDILVKFKPRRA